ncbi:MAG: DMT family transporter [Methylococcaceae bacterium]|nr:DMT family transporter [Methylococcaceae bacterium]
MHSIHTYRGVVYAILAALLFGASTPLGKLLLTQSTPILLAGLLYAGSGIGLSLWLLLRRFWPFGRVRQVARLRLGDSPRLGGAILSGGIAAPILLMQGLSLTPASTASLLLTTESAFTAVMAWFVFGENFDRRIAAGMSLILLGSMALTLEHPLSSSLSWGSLAVVGACACWALDNNLTRAIAARDATQIAAIKGIVAGATNLGLARLLGEHWPETALLTAAGLVGLFGYGLSLVLFVLSLRHLGAARTGAYFAMAPFFGAGMALALPGESPGLVTALAALLMAWGVWLHLTERHEHLHAHEPMWHIHRHHHDAHHQHEHDFDWDGKEPHTHEHPHVRLVHSHPHFPDIHHRHRHRGEKP